MYELSCSHPLTIRNNHVPNIGRNIGEQCLLELNISVSFQTSKQTKIESTGCNSPEQSQFSAVERSALDTSALIYIKHNFRLIHLTKPIENYFSSVT